MGDSVVEQAAQRLAECETKVRLLMAEVAERRFNMSASEFATYLCKEALPKFYELTSVLTPEYRSELADTINQLVAEATNPEHKEKTEKIKYFKNKIEELDKRIEEHIKDFRGPGGHPMVSVLERERDKYIEMLAQL